MKSTLLPLASLMAVMMAFSAITPAAYAVSKAEGAAQQAEAPRGPHNGVMLNQDNFALEMTVFETGVPPEYRVYPYVKGKPVSPAAVNLSVTVKRLTGKTETFAFKPEADYLRGQGRLKEPHSFDVTVRATYEGKSYQWAYPSYEGRTTLSPAAAKAASIATEVAGPGTIRETLTLQGKLVLNPVSTAKVSARYPGTIRQVYVAAGDKVKAGQKLATIQSSISLTNYDVTAPLAGTVIEVNASMGEQAGEGTLFTVADTSRLRATLQAFPREAEKLKTGALVSLTSLNGTSIAEGKIESLLPDAASAMPVTLATMMVSNPDGQWRPGAAVIGKVTVAEKEVPIAVQAKGLQAFRDFTVVFAKVGDVYEVRMLEMGANDGERVEVLEGLEAGEVYVTENSYIIKADIDKSGASHDH